MATGMTILRVTPAQLNALSETQLQKIATAENIHTRMRSAVDGTTGYWLGEAGEACRLCFIKKEAEVEAMFSRFREHATDLQRIAQNYLRVEQDVATITADLPSDVII